MSCNKSWDNTRHGAHEGAPSFDTEAPAPLPTFTPKFSLKNERRWERGVTLMTSESAWCVRRVCVCERGERESEWVSVCVWERERESGRLRGVMCSVFGSSRSTVIPLYLHHHKLSLVLNQNNTTEIRKSEKEVSTWFSFRCTYGYTRRKVCLYPFLIS